MPSLRDSLDLLDALDTGDHVQDFYFLRHRSEGVWRVHYRTPEGAWQVSSHTRLAVAIENALPGMEPDEEDWTDLI